MTRATRRTFLRSVASSLVVGPLLAACGSSASAPTAQQAATSVACTRSGTRLRRTSSANSALMWLQPAATSAQPRAAITAPTWMPASVSAQPDSITSTGVSSRRAGWGGRSSHLGPAVNRKPAMNRGMKPCDISSPCAAAGATAQGIGQPRARAANTRAHHEAVSASISAAAKKPKRCGAASSQPARQRRCPLF